MTEDQILQKIKAILAENFSIPNEKVTAEATFRGTLGMDSLDIVDFIFFLQQGFGIKDTLEDYRELHTVQKLVGYIKGKAP
jgi:acyl carrier protein